MTVECVICVYGGERHRTQPVTVKLELFLDTRGASTAGLSGTVDYARLAGEVRFLLESCRFKLLETAAEALARYILAPPTDFRIGHPVALSRVLLNLTTNALKFTSEGYVEVTARDGGAEQMEFSVRDTGRGIPPQSMATLFEPFRRRQKQGEYAFSGSGLGLSICRKLVEAMGGILGVETTQGSGTCFHFALRLPPAQWPTAP